MPLFARLPLCLSAMLSGLVLTWAAAVTPAHAQTIDTPAAHAFLLDTQTDTTLFAKDPDEPFPPASMSKMMTVYLLFEQIKAGTIALDDTARVSTDAWKRWAGSEASLMFLREGEEVNFDNLIHGIIVSSGNDACTVAAEAVAGSEDLFAQWMNEKAAELGMTNTRFQNASGWPAEDQYTTARDLATLARATIEDFPELYRFYGETEFTYGKDFRTGEPITQYNRNPLLFRMSDSADGLKTGHTDAAGYGLTASAKRDDRRLILVVSGLESQSQRARESRRLMEYGFRNFQTYTLFEAGETVEDATVWLGQSPKVPLVVEQDITLTLSRKQRNDMTVTLAYDGPVPAPIEPGQPLATLTVTTSDREPLTVPVVAGEAVAPISGFGKVKAALEYIVFGASTQE
ncbi:D-alanyl-D-alanine carboxypeptidase (penicillin-binding protein 5/6) [Rhodothalassium salexigens DSM 2132]|uniref:serine-type D-Ala-D-Ala carboxypeptidase n=1 Tax=Rhodothalassium salexigens DSM 2132 TaxID=1188247 RepID=A0A4R2PW14_RHOSA|nr:D-alanyl-D-alanine carboxypeptidase family protein [Rhodothalassium salexigens]MBB4210177.1 D-alanyl-D-alanine carboxypeptidase (penicillin-binding protein 5/6) [Rhodothalassium salexigens DSM 2132]TCP38341.1 D-alanyl-D-alanine carboxypeptidase (penicillin-binding protein 5/6) [Rhodothalassium salexigens DSM 2132]